MFLIYKNDIIFIRQEVHTMKKRLISFLLLGTLLSISSCDNSIGDNTSLYVCEKSFVKKKSYTSKLGEERKIEYSDDSKSIYSLNIYFFNDGTNTEIINANDIKVRAKDKTFFAKATYKRLEKKLDSRVEIDKDTTQTKEIISIVGESDTLEIKNNQKTDILGKFYFEFEDAPSEFDVSYKDTLISSMSDDSSYKFYKDEAYKINDSNLYVALNPISTNYFSTKVIGTSIETIKKINEIENKKIYFAANIKLSITLEEKFEVKAKDLYVRANNQIWEGFKFISESKASTKIDNIYINEINQNELDKILLDRHEIADVYLIFKNNEERLPEDFTVYYKNSPLPEAIIIN